MADAYYAPSLFVNHGGGPYPVMGKQDDLPIAEALKNVRNLIDFDRVKAIILVTAHWEAEVITISSGERHDLLFDYYNFPPETYLYKYGGKGHPELAQKVHDALTGKKIKTTLDDERGWDHGVFIPMMLIRPEADIPIVQVSILKNHDAREHYELGKVLGEFRKEGVAIIGSGLSYHNMERMRDAGRLSDGIKEAVKFDEFLNEVCTGAENVREGIIRWKKAPEGLEAHLEGKADHLMPLIVAAGAGGPNRGRRVFQSAYHDKFMISGFIWD